MPTSIDAVLAAYGAPVSSSTLVFSLCHQSVYLSVLSVLHHSVCLYGA